MIVSMFGGSNTLIKNGISAGVMRGLVSGGGGCIKNYALGSSTSLQSLYELIRNKDEIISSDLIIAESNINEINNSCNKTSTKIEIIHRNIRYFYYELAKLEKKVVVLIMPFATYINHKNHILINNMHRYYANKFNMNVVDIQKYYDENDLNDFSKQFGPHQLSALMSEIGYQIMKNIDKIKAVSKSISTNVNYKILNHEYFITDLDVLSAKNSMFNENFIKINKNNDVKLKVEKDYYLLGVHSWNDSKAKNIPIYHTYSALKFITNKEFLVKEAAFLNQFNDINSCFKINQNTIILFTDELASEYSEGCYSYDDSAKRMDYFNLIALFLCDKYELLSLKKIQEKFNKKIDIKNDISDILPDILLLKNAISEYLQNFSQNIVVKNKSKAFNALIQFLSCFILNKEKRKAFREKNKKFKFN